MSHSALKYALALSVLLNVGVIGAVTYKALHQGGRPVAVQSGPSAADRLDLTPEQRQRWHALEADFTREFQADLKRLAERRQRLIHAIFSEAPDADEIEAERAAIAQLQAQQQKRVIAQLLKEREILEPAQRQKLAQLLLQDVPIEQLHPR